jgi:hypothetical protein
VWLDVHILDALCDIGRRHGHPLTATWADTMLDRASRTGMRELTAGDVAPGGLGAPGGRRGCRPARGGVDNPELTLLVAAAGVR